MDLLTAYRSLLTDPGTLADCSAATTVPDLLHRLRRGWGVESASDGELIAELGRCNQQVLELEPAALAGRWLPTTYHRPSRSIAWCLPTGHATEPFHDQYLERCLQSRVFNQLVRPRTSLAPLLSAAPVVDGPAPAGFIFHLSRCGSTLVSGCLAELDTATVLSESPLLTELLLDASLTDVEKRIVLPQLIQLQAAPFAGRDRVIVKWNAWDLLAWPVIDAACPGVPRLLLFRDPEEILASHARSSGRHMAGDPSLAPLDPVFGPAHRGDLLDFRIRVLGRLMAQMANLSGRPGSALLDYAALDRDSLPTICRHFGLSPGAPDLERMAQRSTVHSKQPDQPFAADGARKKQWFTAESRRRILYTLGPALRVLETASRRPRPVG